MFVRPRAQQSVLRLMTRESFTQRNSFNFTLAYQAYLLYIISTWTSFRVKLHPFIQIIHEQGARLSSLFGELPPLSFQVDRID